MKIHPIHPAQGGFRPGHCCNDLITILHESTARKKKLHYAFLDIKAAYDSVDRSILWDKCRRKGLSAKEVDMLKLLFDRNSSQVLVDGFLSAPFSNEAGVLQGSVLSPFLYSIFIDDLPRRLELLPQVSINNLNTNCLLYADDVVLMAESPEVLQSLVDASNVHAFENRFQFNVQKCVVTSSQPLCIKIGSLQVPQQDSFRYLGVELDPRSGICTKDFVDRRIRDSINACYLLSRIGMNCGGLSMPASALLYKCFVRSKLEASLCILPLNKSHVSRIESAQQRMLSIILGVGIHTSGTIMRSLLNLPRMSFRIKWLRTSYCRRFVRLNSSFFARKAMSSANSLVYRLSMDIFPDCVPRSDLIKAETAAIQAETAAATDGFFSVPLSKSTRSALTSLPREATRILYLWQMKKFPARAPPTCSNCHVASATQSHIAACSNMLSDLLPAVPPRFRAECALCFKLAEPSILIAEIRRAVSTRLHYMTLSS